MKILISPFSIVKSSYISLLFTDSQTSRQHKITNLTTKLLYILLVI